MISTLPHRPCETDLQGLLGTDGNMCISHNILIPLLEIPFTQVFRASFSVFSPWEMFHSSSHEKEQNAWGIHPILRLFCLLWKASLCRALTGKGVNHQQAEPAAWPLTVGPPLLPSVPPSSLGGLARLPSRCKICFIFLPTNESSKARLWNPKEKVVRTIYLPNSWTKCASQGAVWGSREKDFCPPDFKRSLQISSSPCHPSRILS